MLARREAIESAGFFDERFFMYSDETDLCRRIKMAGWEIRHLPSMTILHYAGKAGIKPRIESLSRLHAPALRAQALLARSTACSTPPPCCSATRCDPSTRDAASLADVADRPTARP